MTKSVAILYGSNRAGRLGIRAVEFARNLLEGRGIAVDIIEPQEYPFPILEKKYEDYGEGEAPEYMVKAGEILEKADAVLVVAGEYNHSAQPGLINILDHFEAEYAKKPAGIMSYSYGQFGGARAAIQLRATLAILGMVTIPTNIAIGGILKALDKEGKPLTEATEKFGNSFIDQLIWYSDALKAAREA
jgi:NAD(P)H-dependent FMN reductase